MAFLSSGKAPSDAGTIQISVLFSGSQNGYARGVYPLIDKTKLYSATINSANVYGDATEYKNSMNVDAHLGELLFYTSNSALFGKILSINVTLR